MKYLFLKTAAVFAVFVGSLTAQAQSVDGANLPANARRLVKISADYYPGETYYLGYTTNPDNSIDKIFYENHEHKLKYFSFQKLANYQAIITNETGGKIYKLVELKGERTSAGVYHIEMRYMKNGLFKNHDGSDFTVFYVPARKGYVMMNTDTNAVVSQCHVTTNFWGSMAVGIDEILSK